MTRPEIPCSTRCQQSAAGRCRCSCHGQLHGKARNDRNNAPTLTTGTPSAGLLAVVAGRWRAVPSIRALVEAAGLDYDQVTTADAAS